VISFNGYGIAGVLVVTGVDGVISGIRITVF
jgi:hypothetical protein